MNLGAIQDLFFCGLYKSKIFLLSIPRVIPLIEYKFSTLIQNETESATADFTLGIKDSVSF
jgi:hypothetical protein